MRDIADVMKRLRPLLVAGGIDVRDFDKLAARVGFTAPEDMGVRWLLLCGWLAAVCPSPARSDAPAWVREVSDIVEGRR